MSENSQYTAHPHPTLPFITITQKNGQELEPLGWSDWGYSIEALRESGGYRSEADARQYAEKELFCRHGDYVEGRVQQALANGDLELALCIAHLRGFHQGAASHKAAIAKNLKRAISNLEPLLR